MQYGCVDVSLILEFYKFEIAAVFVCSVLLSQITYLGTIFSMYNILLLEIEVWLICCALVCMQYRRME